MRFLRIALGSAARSLGSQESPRQALSLLLRVSPRLARRGLRETHSVSDKLSLFCSASRQGWRGVDFFEPSDNAARLANTPADRQTFDLTILNSCPPVLTNSPREPTGELPKKH